jgi:hypothetical protein
LGRIRFRRSFTGHIGFNASVTEIDFTISAFCVSIVPPRFHITLTHYAMNGLMFAYALLTLPCLPIACLQTGFASRGRTPALPRFYRRHDKFRRCA